MVDARQEWAEPFARSLKIGYPDQALVPHLEEMLSWHRRILKDGFTQSDSDIVGNISVAEFGVRFENLIDRLLFQDTGDAERLFPKEISLRAAKERYRKLMKLFHPDTGSNSEDWLNFRAERVNSLYADYKKRVRVDEQHSFSEHSHRVRKKDSKSRGRNRSFSEKRTVSVNSQRRRRRKLSRGKLKQKFGDPVHIERRVMFIAKVCVVSTVVLILVVSFW